MNNLCAYTDFVGDKNIPIKDVTDFTNNYIAVYQKEILIKLLGFDLYLALEAGLSEGTIAQKWTDLKNGSTYVVDGVKKQNPGVKDIVVYYVYCKWLSANYNQITGVGVINSTAENAEKIDPEIKIMAGWNTMVNYYNMVYDFINEKETDYPNWDFTELNKILYGF